MATIHNTPIEWTADLSELADVADMLVSTEWLNTPELVVDFLRAPHKWANIRALWIDHGRPSHATGGLAWDQMCAALDDLDARGIEY